MGCTIILGVTIVIPICMIVMGSIYLHDCPQGEYIPVYLLVGGKYYQEFKIYGIGKVRSVGIVFFLNEFHKRK